MACECTKLPITSAQSGQNARFGHFAAELIADADMEVLAGPVDHYVFLCEATECGKRLEPDCAIDHSLVDRRQIHLHVGEQAVMFFDRHL